jgi:hypothetical protein
MGTGKLPVNGLEYQLEQTITQFVIPAGAGATFSAANNIGTITFNAAHGLTLTPAAGTPPNFFIGFGGSTSGLTGNGILVGNIFRILTIPSTTAITIYTTITAATVTSLTGIPVFAFPFTGGTGSSFVGGPSQLIATAGSVAPAMLQAATVNALLGANCNIVYNPDNTAVFLDGQSTPGLAGGYTPAVAPVYRNLIAASGSGQVWGSPPDVLVFANGTTATSRFSVIE